MPASGRWVVNNGKQRMPPAEEWRGHPTSVSLRPRYFSLTSILTMTRRGFLERPLSKKMSDAAGPTRGIGE